MTLPEEYVSEHVAPGYAATVHASQGLTVDTSHTIATARTGHAARYVGLTRGRQANTAHVCTQGIPEDLPGCHVNPQARPAAYSNLPQRAAVTFARLRPFTNPTRRSFQSAMRAFSSSDVITAGQTPVCSCRCNHVRYR
jgi:hypothetical protein